MEPAVIKKKATQNCFFLKPLVNLMLNSVAELVSLHCVVYILSLDRGSIRKHYSKLFFNWTLDK